ncbi:YqaJ viral recombinase family protein [Acidocella sp.]|jgi:predicted phage-related endonuclease|uniref:YqaJ viral recombinase family protein n=1 Tax=Acidocella sp. TaxID=50710 RepID=UPI002F3E3FB0
MQLGLTAAALEERRKGIGGSDVPKIVAGEWHALWLDKTKRSEPEDLSRVLPVQLGSATEAFNLYWFELMGHGSVSCQGVPRIHEQHKFLRCTLDGLADFPGAKARVIQCKHVSGRQPFEEVIARYAPQVCHEMIVCGLSRGVLSVLIGTDRFEVAELELDPFYASDYVERCAEFWGYVERDEPPPQGAPLPVPPPVEKFRTVSMEGNNAFADAAARWLANKGPAAAFDLAVRDIKALVEPDVGMATGYGLAVKRDKRGLSIKGLG